MDAASPVPDPDPIASEGRRLLEENPELRADIEGFGDRLARGEVPEEELRPHPEALRRLEAISQRKKLTSG